jgi:hypothetical protein
MKRALILAVVLCIVLVGSSAFAGSKAVRLGLMIRPELDLNGTEKIYLGPFLLEPGSAESEQVIDRTAVREFERFLRKLLRRQTRLQIVDEVSDLQPPTRIPGALAEQTEFWKDLGAQTNAEFIVSASIAVEVLDRAGYKTEEYVSPTDGETYFRQVLVEETGFNFDILMMIFDGETGELVQREQVSAFKQRPERKLNQVTDLYTDLYNFENRLLGMFVPRMMPAKRYLYTDLD